MVGHSGHGFMSVISMMPFEKEWIYSSLMPLYKKQ
jgi:hypothetical protein